MSGMAIARSPLGVGTTDAFGGWSDVVRSAWLLVRSLGPRRRWSSVQLLKSSLVVTLVSAYVSVLLVVVPSTSTSGVALFCENAADCPELVEPAPDAQHEQRER